jgi:hypothetical protein
MPSDSGTSSGSVPLRAPAASAVPGSGWWSSPPGSSYHCDHAPSERTRTQARTGTAPVQVTAASRNGRTVYSSL